MGGLEKFRRTNVEREDGDEEFEDCRVLRSLEGLGRGKRDNDKKLIGCK